MLKEKFKACNRFLKLVILHSTSLALTVCGMDLNYGYWEKLSRQHCSNLTSLCFCTHTIVYKRAKSQIRII